jgi:hypothetical protein
MFAIAIFSILGLVTLGIGIVETADNIEVKIRKLDKYTRERFDPYR